MSTYRGISPFHDVSPRRDIPLSWCQPTEEYSPFMMSAHRAIFPFHDVSQQRDIPLSWCQPTEGYPPFMMSAHRGIFPFHDVSPQRDIPLSWCQPQRGVRGMGGGHLKSIHFAPTCCTLVPSPLFTLSASPGWLPDDKMRIGRNADDKMRIEKCGWEINCGWQNTDRLDAQRAFTWDSYQNK